MMHRTLLLATALTLLGSCHQDQDATLVAAAISLRHGRTFGATDEVSMKAVEHRVHWNDLHATVLSLLGIDHARLTFYHNGIRRRLTNVHGEVIEPILS